jgi:hypothetical protein
LIFESVIPAVALATDVGPTIWGAERVHGLLEVDGCFCNTFYLS